MESEANSRYLHILGFKECFSYKLMMQLVFSSKSDDFSGEKNTKIYRIDIPLGKYQVIYLPLYVLLL